jgi:hypothetical protein
MNSGFAWTVSPDVIGQGLERYGDDALYAIHMVATRWGQDIQNQARDSETWEDRTGNARSGLFFAVDGFGFRPFVGQLDGEVLKDAYKDSRGGVVNRGRIGDVTVERGSADTLIITLGHSVFYGKYLELSNGGKNAVIMSTIESNLPNLEQMLRDALSG